MQSMQAKQVIFLIIILFAFLIIFGFLIYTSSAGAAINEETLTLKRKLIKYEDSDITIDADEVIDGDIVIKNGTITIAGEIHGNIIALSTDVYLEPKAKIFGHIVLYDGEVVRDDQTGVGGDIVIVTDDDINITEGRQLPSYNYRLNTFKSDVEIEEDETNYGDILVFDSDIDVDGKIEGCVINFFGETTINDEAAVDGNIISFEGRIRIEDEALVTGRAIRLTAEEKISKYEEIDEEDKVIQERIERKYLKRNRETKSDIFRFWGNVTVEPDEFIRGDALLRANGLIVHDIGRDVDTEKFIEQEARMSMVTWYKQQLQVLRLMMAINMFLLGLQGFQLGPKKEMNGNVKGTEPSVAGGAMTSMMIILCSDIIVLKDCFSV